MIKQVRNWLRGSKRVRRAASDLDPANIPVHVAIIMDGNGRWATKRGLPRIAGHHSGMKAVKKAVIAADQIGVKVLTLYAFSTENWVRPKDEVDFLMKLPQEFFPLEIDELYRKNVKIRMTGWEEHLPLHTLGPVKDAIEKNEEQYGTDSEFRLELRGQAGTRLRRQELVERRDGRQNVPRRSGRRPLPQLFVDL